VTQQSTRFVPKLGDPLWAKVALLLKGDVSPPIDSTGKNTITLGTGVTQSTAQSKWGGGSLAWAGTVTNVITETGAAPPLANIGTQDFCIEAWVRPAGTTGANKVNKIITLRWPNSSGNVGTTMAMSFLAPSNGATLSGFNWETFSGASNSSDGTRTSTKTVSMPLNVWYHICAERIGSTLTLYVDGVSVGTINLGSGYSFFYDASQKWYIGGVIATNANNNSHNYNGYMDDLRVTIGAYRYNGNFTPPTEPFLVG